MDSEARELIDQFEQLYRAVANRTTNIQYNHKEEQGNIAVALYYTILESAAGCILLLRHNQAFGASTLARTLLEAYVDLANVVKYPEYVHILGFISADSRRKYLERLFQPKETDKLFSELPRKLELQSELDEYNAECENPPDLNFPLIFPDIKWPAKKDKDISTKKWFKHAAHKSTRFQIAGMEEVYAYHYSWLSDDTHNGLASLGERHVVRDANRVHLGCFNPTTMEQVSLIMEVVPYYLCDSLCQLSRIPDLRLSGNEEQVQSAYVVLAEQLSRNTDLLP